MATYAFLVFYPAPLRIRGSPAPAGKASSCSTTFVFAILSEYSNLSGHGIAFVISRSANLHGASSTRGTRTTLQTTSSRLSWTRL
ncbi:hypothetical protein Taro_003660 [Colocasia esculenta]|uniref:Legume lectin domain-containing protein n=1 Tax=Colocasia esculenta TaxID=4460 RepID=A0A843TJY9_COLES|nr:hypothetical protein [Colocasia esculenta]